MGVLEGKAVVITGAGRGLGEAFARHAARSGAAVVVNDVDGKAAQEVVSSIQESGGRAVAGVGSVADPEHADALIERCVAWFGAVDGLVNNAGLRHQAMLWEEDPHRMRALVETNVLGVLYCGAAAAKAMRAQGRGAIVNIGSLAMLGQATAATYSASKGAVASMTFAWAVELAEFDIRVNGVCPVAWTRMAEADRTPAAARTDTPDKMAPLVTYLLSDLAAGVTGQLIRFVGGALHIVRQPALKEPVLRRDHWEVPDIAAAFDDELAAVLEPPPRFRWTS